jgi:large subunit ribosomal protein L21
MYAIVRTGGKQYRVEEGRHIDVERLPDETGATVELKDVLLIAEDGSVTVGSPVIDGARVVADVESHGRSKKIIVFKYKSKVRSRKMAGHRQHYTRLAVKEILLPGQEAKTIEKPKRRAKAAAAEETPAAAAKVEAPAAEVVVEAPAPKRTRRATPKAEPVAEKKPATRTTTARKAAAPKAKAEPKAKKAAPKATKAAPTAKKADEKKPARRPAARRTKKEE